MKRMRKVVLASALLLAPLLSAASASAAPVTQSCNPHKVIAYKVNLSDGSFEKLKDYKWLWSILQPYLPQTPNKQQPVPKEPAQPAPQPAKPAPQPTNPSTGQKNPSSISTYAKEVFNLVNQERQKAGLQPLTLNEQLSVVALDKAKDMYYNGYFSHQSPTYGSPFDMMRKYGISYRTAGENIAKGQRSPQEVMRDWMNSPGHRTNILNPNFKSIGVAHFNGIWVQMFIG